MWRAQGSQRNEADGTRSSTRGAALPERVRITWGMRNSVTLHSPAPPVGGGLRWRFRASRSISNCRKSARCKNACFSK